MVEMVKRRKKHPGRPQGAKTRKLPSVDVHPSRCPGCGSTSRGKYSQALRMVLHAPQQTQNGFKFDEMVYRVTQCRKCGKFRKDVFFEFSGEETELLTAAKI